MLERELQLLVLRYSKLSDDGVQALSLGLDSRQDQSKNVNLMPMEGKLSEVRWGGYIYLYLYT